MSVYILKMNYEKSLEQFLELNLENPSSNLNRSICFHGGTLLSCYRTQAGNDLIFIIEADDTLAKEIQQSIIRKAPTLFREMKRFEWTAQIA